MTLLRTTKLADKDINIFAVRCYECIRMIHYVNRSTCIYGTVL